MRDPLLDGVDEYGAVVTAGVGDRGVVAAVYPMWNGGDQMKMRVKLALAFLLSLGIIVVAGFCFDAMNQPSDVAVSGGVIGLCLLAIFSPWVYRAIFHRKEQSP